MILKALGKRPSATQLAAFAKSSHFVNGAFANVEPTEMLREGASYPKLLRDAFNRPKSTSPSTILPSVRLDLHKLTDSTAQIVWFGHSSYLISHNGFRILMDPVLFGNSSPVGFIGKPFPITNPYSVADIPPIDLLVLSHDHYDHLDYVTLTKIRDRIKRVICPLGVSSHLKYWGFDPAIITELAWHTKADVVSGISVTALPARHFSGRVFTRNTTQWSSYALKLHHYNIFLGGDSGYDRQFKIIGDKYGPFDLAMLECGQYGVDWPHIHMFPEETAKAATDLRTRRLLPVHWGKFVLANHPWSEPIERLIIAAENADYDVITPNIGDVVRLSGDARANRWWEKIAKG